MSSGSYIQILRSSSIIGGASVINIVVRLLRMKVAAVLLGPAGVGLIGLLSNLADTASTVAGLGVGMVGTRQIAEASGRNDKSSMAAARRALFWGTLVLALLGASVFWALREALAVRMLGDATLAVDVGWLALAVGLTVAASSQTALLNGMRQIGDLARISVLAALLSTFLGIGSLVLWGRGGLMAFIIAGPLSSFLLGLFYVSRLPKVEVATTPWTDLVKQWRSLFKLGLAFLVAGLAGTLAQLIVRILIQREMGPDALGFFQAATTISLTYISFVLTAMGADYFPRLTASINDHAEVNRMVNEQTEVALLLAGPVFLAVIGMSPWVIELLYSSSFYAASDLLRWQVMGDILKVASWPLGFVILAAGAGRTFMLIEILGYGVFVLLTWIMLPIFGLNGTGIAFLGMYIAILPVVYFLARVKTGFCWTSTVWRLLCCLICFAIIVLAVSQWASFAGALIGIVTSVIFGIYSINHLAHKSNLSGHLLKINSYSRYLLIKLKLFGK